MDRQGRCSASQWLEGQSFFAVANRKCQDHAVVVFDFILWYIRLLRLKSFAPEVITSAPVPSPDDCTAIFDCQVFLATPILQTLPKECYPQPNRWTPALDAVANITFRGYLPVDNPGISSQVFGTLKYAHRDRTIGCSNVKEIIWFCSIQMRWN